MIGKKYPLILEPIYKERVWGGNRLLPECDNIGESWVLSVRAEDDVIVENGTLSGMKLGEVLRLYPDFLGESADSDDFPILIKFIDSREALSIQVHPDDETAMILGCERGKTEMWYIIEADPDAFIYYGVQGDTELDMLKEKILRGEDPTEHLNKVHVKSGDCFLIEGGTPHAIGAGIYLAEIQQNCDTTFRIYDYCRLGLDGRPRELHLHEASVAIKNNPCENERRDDQLVSCRYFKSSLLELDGKVALLASQERFVSLTVISGEGFISSDDTEYAFSAGGQIFIPAGREEYSLTGKAVIIETTV